MTRNCTVDRRAAAQDAADKLATTPTVAATDVLDPATGPRDQWTIEVIVARTYVPSVVHFALGAAGLATEDQSTRPASGTTQVVAVIEQ